MFDVVVDLRPGSLTCGKYHGELLPEKCRKQFLIPRGFTHGFLVLSETAEFWYKCYDFYYPNDEVRNAWNDPEISIRTWRDGRLSREHYLSNAATLFV